MSPATTTALLLFTNFITLLLAQTTSIPLISGDGPRPPTLTATAVSGTLQLPTTSVVVSGTTLAPPSYTGTGRQLQINGADDFCLLMPPDPTTENLVDAEAVAVAYCINPYNNTRPFPDGFIKTAHYRVTADYVQISGTYNAAAMNINPSNCGGEYDNHGAEGVGNPVGAAVDGATNFAQFIGGCDIPGVGTFCLRACHGDDSYAYCKNTYDLMGCLWTMPGDYDTSGFTSCSADLDLPIGSYSINGTTSTFTQGMSSTPLPVTAPASSNCATTNSPAAKGVTYGWEAAVTGVALVGASSSGGKTTTKSGSAAPTAGGKPNGAVQTTGSQGGVLGVLVTIFAAMGIAMMVMVV